MRQRRLSTILFCRSSAPGAPIRACDGMFFVMIDNESTPEYRALNKEVAPRLAAADDEIYFDAGLFKRIETIYGSRSGAGLTAEQVRLVERTYNEFARSGATLNAADKTRLSQINQELASLFADFSDKLLADENTWVVLDSKADLAGLPDSIVSAAAAAASDHQLDGKWLIVNTRSSVEPFLTFSTPSRSARAGVAQVRQSRRQRRCQRHQ